MGQIVTQFVTLPATIVRREDSLKGENPWNCKLSSIFEIISDVWHELCMLLVLTIHLFDQDKDLSQE